MRTGRLRAGLILGALLAVGVLGLSRLPAPTASAAADCESPVGRQEENDCGKAGWAQDALSESVARAVDRDRAATRQERRAARLKSRVGWKDAARLRQDARIAVKAAILVARSVRPATGISDPGLRRSTVLLRNRVLAELKLRLKLMNLQLAADLLRVRKPRGPFPTLARNRRAVSSARRATVRAGAAARRAVGPAVRANLGDTWTRHDDRLGEVFGAVARASKELPRDDTQGRRDAQAEQMTMLWDLYRRETREMRQRVRRIGGVCGPQMLAFLAVQGTHQKRLKAAIGAGRANRIAKRRQEVRRYNKVLVLLRALRAEVQSCVDGSPPQAPPTPPPPGSLPVRNAATPESVCPAAVTDGSVDKVLVREGRFSEDIRGVGVDGRPLTVYCWYSTDGTSDATAGARTPLVVLTMWFPDDGAVTVRNSGACGAQTPSGGFAVSGSYYLDAEVNPDVQDRDAVAQEALAKAEAAGVAIPCSWRGAPG